MLMPAYSLLLCHAASLTMTAPAAESLLFVSLAVAVSVCVQVAPEYAATGFVPLHYNNWPQRCPRTAAGRRSVTNESGASIRPGTHAPPARPPQEAASRPALQPPALIFSPPFGLANLFPGG